MIKRIKKTIAMKIIAKKNHQKNHVKVYAKGYKVLEFDINV